MDTYKSAGVNLENSRKLVSLISNSKDENSNSFAGVFSHPLFEDYLLVSTTDGVGTKIEPLFKKKDFKTLALDLIAMNFNDLACLGARPLFFLDYIATSKLDPYLVAEFLNVLKFELNKRNCRLLGGETSELNILNENTFDVAGFCVGVVKSENLLKKENVKENDVLIALKSSGVHSNGFSLLRKLDKENKINIDNYLNPTTIYTDEICTLAENKKIKAAANITGGGIKENLSRIIPKGLIGNVYEDKIVKSDIFLRLEDLLDKNECFNTFNMNVGFIVVSDKKEADFILNATKKYDSYVIGEVVKNDKNEETACICFGEGN